jgi:hypothetical protein
MERLEIEIFVDPLSRTLAPDARLLDVLEDATSTDIMPVLRPTPFVPLGHSP